MGALPCSRLSPPAAPWGRAAMAAARPQPPENGLAPPENGLAPLDPPPPAPRLLPHVDASVLPSLGGFGRHQKQLVVLTWIPALFIGFSQFSDYFLLAQPNGTCLQPSANGSQWTAAVAAAAAPNPLGGTDDVPALWPQVNGTGAEDGVGGLPCACEERTLELHTGLSQNVVTKVTREHHTGPQIRPGEVDTNHFWLHRHCLVPRRKEHPIQIQTALTH